MPAIDKPRGGSNAAEEKLLIEQSRVRFYQDLLVFVPLLLLLGAIGVLLKDGWLLTIIDGLLFWGIVLTFTALRNWEGA